MCTSHHPFFESIDFVRGAELLQPVVCNWAPRSIEISLGGFFSGSLIDLLIDSDTGHGFPFLGLSLFDLVDNVQ